MKVNRCKKCGSIYPDDMTQCPGCGTENNMNNTGTMFSSPVQPSPVYTPPKRPVVTCPYCQSTNCRKISVLSKVGNIAFWGIFAVGKASKQWHCKTCKSDF